MPTSVSTFSEARLAAAIETFRARIYTRAAVPWAQMVEARMRSEASWTDRNGPSKTGENARESLEAEAAIEDDGNITIVGRSTRQTLTPWRGWDGAPLGAFLELGTVHMQARPVIWPVLKSSAPDLKRRVQTVLSGG